MSNAARTEPLIKTFQVTDLHTGETIATHYEDWRAARHTNALNDQHADATGNPSNRYRYASILVWSNPL